LPSTVTNLLDAGPGSLRQALTDTPTGGTVDFQADLTGTILLTTGQLEVTQDLSISGPGSGVIMVSGNNASRVFHVEAGVHLAISGLSIVDGTVTGDGGGILNSGTLTVTDATISENSAGVEGGGIDNEGNGTLTVTGSLISGNTAPSGGGIQNDGIMTMTACPVSNNTAVGGGGINSNGTLSLTASVICNNNAGDEAGGLFVGGSTTISTCLISGNSASGSDSFVEGGGMALNTPPGNSVTISSCTISDNSASGPEFVEGGGIWNDGLSPVTFINSTISGNVALGGLGGSFACGGGIFDDSTAVNLVSCTFSGNSAPGGGGGAIYASLDTVTVMNCTISGNSAGYAGGLSFLQGFTAPPITLANTIVAGNAGAVDYDAFSDIDVEGTLNSQGHNLIGNGSGASGYAPSDLVGTAFNPIDPVLGPLQDNGGSTQTMAVLAGSPALNAGDPAQLGVPDQRGVVRTGGVNIGAYQASATTFLLVAPDAIQAGVPFNLSVTAVDPFGQVAYGYAGTVAFASDDTGAMLPDDYQFQPSDQGSATFMVTLNTQGPVHLTVADTADNTVFAALDLIVL
jgi:predicted outer membrane repeat protein